MKDMLLMLLFSAPPTLWAATPHPALASLEENTALDLGPYVNNPLGCMSAVEITAYSRFTYDPVNHRILMFGGGHAATSRTDVDAFSFDTLSWGSDYAPTPFDEMMRANMDDTRGAWESTGHPIARHVYDLMTFAPNTSELVLLTASNGRPSVACLPSGFDTSEDDYYHMGAKVAHYNPVSKEWMFSTAPSVDYIQTSEYDPVSGMIILLNGGELLTYDPIGKTMTSRRSLALPMGYANNLVYYPPNDRFYYIARGPWTDVWELALNRADWEASTVSLVPPANAAPGTQESGWAYDSVNKIIGGGVLNGSFHAYHPPTRTWMTRTVSPQSTGGAVVGTLASHALDYDPVDNVFLFMTQQGSAGRMWAYRYGGPGPVPTSFPGRPERLRVR